MAATEKSTDVRARLVAVAVGLLEAEGPGAVQARRLTREIGASTTAVYHYFGGMPQLLRAVADEGFTRLDAHLSAVTRGADAVADVCALALAYRAAARENPHLYDLMFGIVAPGGHRPEHGDAVLEGPGLAAFTHLVTAVTRAVEQGRLGPHDPFHAAAQLWGVLHGFVSLELAGMFRDLDDPVRDVLLPMGVHLLIGLGDTPERAVASGQRVLQRG